MNPAQQAVDLKTAYEAWHGVLAHLYGVSLCRQHLFMHVHVCVWYESECIYVVWICESSLCVFGVRCGEMRKEEWIDNTERGRRAERTRRRRRRGTASLGCTTVPLCVRAMSFASLVTVQHML